MKKTLYMMLLCISGLILGGLIGNASTGTFKWLGYSKTLKFMPESFIIDTDVFKLDFGIYFSACVAQILFLLVAVFVYYKTAPKLFPGK